MAIDARCRFRAANRDGALHPCLFVPGDGADESQATFGNRHVPAGGGAGAGGDLRAISKGDVVRDRAGIAERDVITAGRWDCYSGWLEPEVEGFDLDLATGRNSRVVTRMRRRFGGALVAVARAAGETAPLLFVAGIPGPNVSLDPFQPMNALPLTIFVKSQSPNPADHTEAWGAALLLIFLVLVISIVARALSARSRRRLGAAR